jgi:hypothetical protein
MKLDRDQLHMHLDECIRLLEERLRGPRDLGILELGLVNSLTSEDEVTRVTTVCVEYAFRPGGEMFVEDPPFLHVQDLPPTPVEGGE